MHRIFTAHLETDVAQSDLDALADLVHGGRRTCLLCFEADPAHCHRSIVADALGRRMPIDVRHLTVVPAEQD